MPPHPATTPRQKSGLAGLAAVAAAAWAGEIYAGTANLDDHIWASLLTVAAISSLAAIQFGLIIMLAQLLGGVNDRLDKAIGAATALRDQRPDPAVPTPPPWRGLRSVPGGEPGQEHHATLQ